MQSYSLTFLQLFKENAIQSLSEKFPEHNIIKEFTLRISELINKDNDLNNQVLPVENKKIELSPNKRSFIDYEGVKLFNGEVFQASQSFQRRKKIQIYSAYNMPAYLTGELPGYNSLDVKLDTMNILHIQNHLAENEYAGYLIPEIDGDENRVHVGCLIVTKTQVIKPMIWNIDYLVPGDDYYDRVATANLPKLALNTLTPQADGQSCASLGLSYLKQLLKDDAKQLKELCFIFPYLNENSENLNYFFIPSPQALRYSQSSTYNLFMKKLVAEDKPGSIIYKGSALAYTPIKQILLELQLKAKKEDNFVLENEIESLLEQLPHFRKRWLHAYEQMDNYRSLMNQGSFNTGLQYASRRLRKIALMEQEQKQNPGLTLLNNLEEKKRGGYSDEQLLAIFSECCGQLKFKTAYQIGYFLDKLNGLIDSEKIYPIFFTYENHTSLIKGTVNYKECLFFLNPKQRECLNTYFKQNSQFSRLQDEDKFVENITEWLHLLAIPEQDKFAFLEEKMPRDKFALLLLTYLVAYAHRFNRSFEDKKALALFLMNYIGKENLIVHLPACITNIANLKIMFSSENEFFNFIEEHLPINKALVHLKTLQYYDIFFCKYLYCLPADKRSIILLTELNDCSSDLFKKLCSGAENYERLKEILGEFCNEIEVADYLKKLSSLTTLKQEEPSSTRDTTATRSSSLGLFDVFREKRPSNSEPDEHLSDDKKTPK